MEIPRIEAKTFSHEGNAILSHAACVPGETVNRRFRAMFGVGPDTCEELWDLIRGRLPPSARPYHLLWALLFLKVYGSEHIYCALTKTDEKTFRKWSWIFIEMLSELCVIKWSGRLTGRERRTFKASVDGVDFKILEPSPFNPSWFSHKFKGPGVRYEIAVGIENDNIVWAHGLFPCGSWNDLKIYQTGLKHMLSEGEKVVADGGYNDETTSFGNVEYRKGNWEYIRARHEAVNKRLKQFMVLSRRFRHRLERHSDYFFAVLNITYLLIKNEPVFE